MLVANYTGRQIGDFLIEERLGHGGMAGVYRAYQTSVNRYVALKIISLDPAVSEQREFGARFAQEAEVIASLEHIHILPIYAYGIHQNEVAFLAMRLLRGGSLADLLRAGPLDLEQAANIFTQVALGLDHAHQQGVIHRDLKPSNILLDDSGNAFLSDFGLAKLLRAPAHLTEPGSIIGTPAYAAPEQVRGEPSDPRSDIYGLGALLYHMLVGRPPFASDDGVMTLLYKQIEQMPPRPGTLNPDITREVDAVVMRALAKRREDRYQSADEMIEALNIALGRQSSGASFGSSRSNPRLGNASRLRPRLLIAGAALLLLVAAAIVLLVRTNGGINFTAATILAGERGTIADVVPTDEVLTRARARLGGDGFIAFVACTLTNTFQVTRAREIGDMASQFDLAYRVYDSRNDAYTQITEIEKARIDGARAFIICPLETNALADTLASMARSRIPVVFITLFDHDYGVKLDSDNYQIGLKIGDLTGEIIHDEYSGSASVLILGYPGFPASDMRVRGIRDGILAAAPDARILGDWLGFSRENGYATVRRLIDQGMTFDVIASMNDAGSIGAIDALEEAGFARDSIPIVSANAEAPALDLMREERFIRGSVAVNREEGSRLALYAAIQQLAGGTLPEILSFPPGDMITRETLIATAAEITPEAPASTTSE